MTSLAKKEIAKNNTIVDNTTVDISLVVDRSSSMSSQKEAPAIGIYDFLASQKANATTPTSVSITTFDDSVEHPCSIKDIMKENIPSIETLRSWITPRGSTRLIDTAIETLQAQKERASDSKRIFVLVTDGQDNCSKNSTTEMNTSLRESRSEGVSCIFLGSNQDAITSGKQYGFSAGLCLSTDSNPSRASEGLKMCSNAVTRSIKENCTGVETVFTRAERQSSAPSILTKNDDTVRDVFLFKDC